MPRIKFQPRETTTLAPSERPAKVKPQLLEGKLQRVQLPSSLSRLIEHQLLANTTNLLLQHKNLTGLGALAPSTSTSRVVRLRDQTTLVQAPGGSSKAEIFPRDLKRQASKQPESGPLGGGQVAAAAQGAPTSTSSAGSQASATATKAAATPTTTTVAPPPTASGAPAQSGGESTGERRYTEPAALQRSLPAPVTSNTLPPTKAPAAPSTTAAPTTTPTTTTTTTAAAATIGQANQEEPIGSNKVLPEEEEQAQQLEVSSTGRPIGFGQTMDAQKFIQLHAGAGRPNGKNIKLFHFKRKPDMKKLPFFKKPLNFSELGWTGEQIQEHLELAAAAAAAATASGGDSEQLALGQQVAAARQQASWLNGTREQGADLLLLKRKRRGKNQFERLMAELHGQSAMQASSTEPEESLAETTTSATSRPVHPSGAHLAPEQERVPVIKKKVEPLVMKPMFFVISQKRRPAGERLELPSTTLAPEAAEPAGRGQNRSKPIIRMRRKHQGDQPSPVGAQSARKLPIEWEASQAWRPSNPLWSTARQSNQGGAARALPGAQAGDQLMLVPSGLLTPSGSHLVPLYTAATGLTGLRAEPLASSSGETAANKLVGDSFAWRPSRQASSGQPHSNWPAESKPSGGLAPSGEESFLLAPSAPMPSKSEQHQLVLVATSASEPRADKQTSQRKPAAALSARLPQTSTTLEPTTFAAAAPAGQQAKDSGELRVPKLLVKPMRPAKYSLNGYIPKPSLGQQQQQQQQQQQPQQQQASTPSQPVGSKLAAQKIRPKAATSSSLGGMAAERQVQLTSGKDLVS